MQQHVRFGRIAAVLPVKDIQLAKAFYVDGLNFDVVFENGDPVGFVILKREAAELHLTLFADLDGNRIDVGQIIGE